ncbi:hypothetical protein OAS78_12755 [Pseudomonadales bacterium]|nr:hypothetical protein [Pseudomonadales bacterium]
MKLIAKSKVTGDINNGVAWGAEKAPLQLRETTESPGLLLRSLACSRQLGLVANENHSY